MTNRNQKVLIILSLMLLLAVLSYSWFVSPNQGTATCRSLAANLEDEEKVEYISAWAEDLYKIITNPSNRPYLVTIGDEVNTLKKENKYEFSNFKPTGIFSHSNRNGWVLRKPINWKFLDLDKRYWEAILIKPLGHVRKTNGSEIDDSPVHSHGIFLTQKGGNTGYIIAFQGFNAIELANHYEPKDRQKVVTENIVSVCRSRRD